MVQYEIRVGVGAIVKRSDGKLLLGKRNVVDNRGAWELFGGLVGPNETLEAAVIRQVREETGIEIKRLSIVATYVRDFDRKHVKNVGLCYLCEYLSGEEHITKFGRINNFM